MNVKEHMNLHPWRGIRPWRRHSLVLLVAGVIYVLIGVAYITTPTTNTRAIALQVAYHWMDPNGWGLLFIFVGLMGIVSSRWPPISETWGYVALTGMSAGWSAVYAVGIIFGSSPTSNISGVLTWGLLGFMWWAVSGLVNPTNPVVIVLPERG